MSVLDLTIVERIELNERTDEALVSVEHQGVRVVGVVPTDLDDEHVDEALTEIGESLSDHVPRRAGGEGS